MFWKSFNSSLMTALVFSSEAKCMFSIVFCVEMADNSAVCIHNGRNMGRTSEYIADQI